MATEPFTLMAVHAHPDDEASSTGGALARYHAEGVRTVLVTCTDGSCGDGPGGVKPGEPGHDPAAVASTRKAELETSCARLGVSHLEMLGFADSGMMGWAANDQPGSFWGMDVGQAARPLVALMERYRPQVVLTYDANGFYGHPDHIQAHRITMAAVEATGIPAKVYFPTVPRSRLAEFARRARQAGAEVPEAVAAENSPDQEEFSFTDFGADDEDIAAWLDVSSVIDAKWEAISAHASQSETIFFVKLGKEVFSELMSVEPYLRALDRTGTPVPEEDLFAGLR